MRTYLKRLTGLMLAIIMIVSLLPVGIVTADTSTGGKFVVDGKEYILMDATKEIGGKTYHGVLSTEKLTKTGGHARPKYTLVDGVFDTDNEVIISIFDDRIDLTDWNPQLQDYVTNFSAFDGYIAPSDTEWVIYNSTPTNTNLKTKIYFKGSVGCPTLSEYKAIIAGGDSLSWGEGDSFLVPRALSFWDSYYYWTGLKPNGTTDNVGVGGTLAGDNGGGTWYFMTYVDETFFCKKAVDDFNSTGSLFKSFLRDNFTKKELRAAGYTEAETVSLGFPAASADATGVQLDKTELNVTQGTVDTIKAYVLPLYEAKNELVHWSTSNANVATVTDGKVMGRKEGTATITATTDDGGYKATCTVNVIPGKVYYVSAEDGDDENNNGTIDAPYATIQRAVDEMKPGEFVSVRGGNYRETVTFKKSGTATAPLTLMAYGDEEVTVSGTDKISNWTVDSTVGSNTVWKAYVGTVIDEEDMVFFNNDVVDYAKWPNNTGDNNSIRPEQSYHDASHPGLKDDWLFPTWASIDSATGKPDGQSVSAKYFGTIYDAELPFEADELIGATILSKPGEGWYMYTGEITDSDVGSFYIEGQMQFEDAYRPTKNNDYYIYGSKVLLDYQNEWYCDDEGYIYIITPDGTDPNNASVEVKTRLNAIDFNENDYINVEGLNLFAGELDMQKSDNCNITGITIDYVNNGPVMSGKDNRFAESTVRHSLNALMTVAGKDNKVINNLFEYGSLNGAAAAVNLSGSLDAVVAYNTVRFVGSTGIGLTNKGGALLTYNDVSYYSIVCRDNGGFYGGHIDGINMEVSYNWAHDGMSGTTGGIYTDNGFQNIIIHHNVVWNSCWGYQTNAPRTGRLVYNNTFAAHSGTSWIDIDYSENNLAMNNIFTEGSELDMYNEWLTGGTYVDGGSSGRRFDSIFKEYNNVEIPKAELAGMIATDFVPKKGDDVVDAGVVIDNINEDYVGDAPDIGAYEYGGDIWVPGHNFEDKTLKDKEFIRVADTKYANKVVNGGFEVTGDLEEVTVWKKTGAGNAVIQSRTSSIYANNPATHTGNNGVKFGSTDTAATGTDGIQQTVTGLKPNTRYQLMAAGRIDDQTGANPITMTVTGATFPETTVAEPAGNSLTINTTESVQKDFLLVDVKEGRNGEKVYGLLSKDANDDDARYIGIADDTSYTEDGVVFKQWQSAKGIKLFGKIYLSDYKSIESRCLSNFGKDMQEYMLLTDWEIRECNSSGNPDETSGTKMVVRSKLSFPSGTILKNNISSLNSPSNVPAMDYVWDTTGSYYYTSFYTYANDAITPSNSVPFGITTRPWLMTYVRADFFREIPLDVATMGDYVKYRLKTDFTQEELEAQYGADVATINAAPDATVTTKSEVIFDNYKWDERTLDFVTDETGTVTISISKPTAGMGYIDDVTIYEASDTPVKDLEAEVIPAYLQSVADSYTFEYEGKKFILLEDGDGSNFIFCPDDYGKAVYDANNEQRFNPRDTDNIAYMLNNSLDLPANIKAHLETDHIWVTEAGEKGNNSPINYEAKGGVALLSYGELLKHGAKISRTEDANTGAIGWWLRTGSQQRDEMLYVTSSDSRMLSDINGSFELNVRPVIYLEDAFFTKVKLDTTKMGENVKKFLTSNFTRTQLSKAGYSADELDSFGSVLKPIDSSNYVAAADGSFELLFNNAIVAGTETYIGFMLPVDYAGKADKKGTTLIEDNVDPLGNILEDNKYGEFYMTASKESVSSGVSLDDTVIPTLPKALKDNLYLKEWDAGVAYNITGQSGMAKAKTYISLPSEAEFTEHAPYVENLVLDNNCGKTTSSQTHSEKVAALRTVEGYNAKVYDAEAKDFAKVDQGVQYVAGSVFPTFYVNANILKETRLDLETLNVNVKALFAQLFVRDDLLHLYSEEELDELGVTDFMSISKSSSDGSSFVIGTDKYYLMDSTMEVNGDKYYGVMAASYVSKTHNHGRAHLESTDTEVDEDTLVTVKIYDDRSVSTKTDIQTYVSKFAPFDGYLIPEDTEWVFWNGVPRLPEGNTTRTKIYMKGSIGLPTKAEVTAVNTRDTLVRGTGDAGIQTRNLSFWTKYYWSMWTPDGSNPNPNMNLNNGSDTGATWYLMTYVREDFFKNTDLNVSMIGEYAQDILRTDFTYDDMTGWSDANRDALFYGTYEGSGIGLVADKKVNTADNTLDVGVCVNNNGNTIVPKGVNIVIAAYDGDKLEKVKIVELSKQVEANSVTSKITAQIPVSNLSADYTVKVMLWDSIYNVKPLAGAVTLD